MRKFENGQYVEMSAKEEAAFVAQQARDTEAASALREKLATAAPIAPEVEIAALKSLLKDKLGVTDEELAEQLEAAKVDQEAPKTGR